MVGFAQSTVTLIGCLVDTKEGVTTDDDGKSHTFVTAATGITPTMKRCYFTRYIGLNDQGECVFNKISLPEGCSYEFVSPSTVQLGDVPATAD